ncbi:MAG: hypothetical protein WC651_04905 [Candidatus Gracilibacteria bacterium]|jgi:hypothetical protein
MQKIIKKILVLAFVSISLLTVTTIAYAADAQATPATPTTTTQPFKPSYIPKPANLPGPEATEQETKGTRTKLVDEILPKFAIGLIGMTGGFALLMIVIGGVRYLTAYSNDEAAGKGKTQIIYGIVGMIIALLSYTIVIAITNIKLDNQNPQPVETQTPAKP